MRRDPAALEPGLQAPAFAFNLTVLSSLLGTPLEPDFAGAELLIEEVSEHHYRIDRTMFHLTASANVRSVARMRLGRVGDIPANDPDFGSDEEAIVADWCGRSGIAFGGRADIGHDAANRVVPFGQRSRSDVTRRRAIAKASALRSTKGDTTGGPQWQKLRLETT